MLYPADYPCELCLMCPQKYPDYSNQCYLHSILHIRRSDAMQKCTPEVEETPETGQPIRQKQIHPNVFLPAPRVKEQTGHWHTSNHSLCLLAQNCPILPDLTWRPMDVGRHR